MILLGSVIPKQEPHDPLVHEWFTECMHACNPSLLSFFLLWTRRNWDFTAKHWEETPNIQWKSSVYPWNGEGFLVVECLSQQRLPVCLIYVYHCLAHIKKKQMVRSTLKTSNSCSQVKCATLQSQQGAHHVPKLVKGHYKSWAHSPQPFKGPDMNFDPYLLLNASVQLSQRTALAYWKHMTGHTPSWGSWPSLNQWIVNN